MRCFHPTSPHGFFLALFTLLYERKLFTQLSWDACWTFGQCSPYCNSPSPHLAVIPSYKILPLLFDRILWKTSFHDGPYDLHSWDSIPCLILSLCLWTGPNQSFSSVPQSCQPISSSMDCSTPGFPVHHQLSELAQTHIHWVSDAIQTFHPLSSSSPPAFNPFQVQGLFQRVSSSHQVAKVLEFQLQHQSFQWIFRTDFF